MKCKSCNSDPIPVWLLKESVYKLIPIIHYIVSQSLKYGYFPSALKHAIVTPVIKNQTGDVESLSNCRLINNVTSISKLLEKCVQLQFQKYIENENLHSPYQSGYRAKHSYETANMEVI